MPHPRVEPVSEGVMLNNKAWGHHTICQTLREIFQMSDNEEIKYKCRLAMAMAKKMQNRLLEYKAKEEQK